MSMVSDIEKELDMTMEQYHAMSRDEQKAKGAGCTPEQIQRFNALCNEALTQKIHKERMDGTYPMDVEMRAFILQQIREATTIGHETVVLDNLGRLFEDYITTYPVNMAMQNPMNTTSLGAYGGILNFELLNKAIDEIIEVAFDKIGFMLEYQQNFAYLSPTFGMIASAIRAKMPEFDSSNSVLSQ